MRRSGASMQKLDKPLHFVESAEPDDDTNA
jgi:hypothetical protein